MTAREQVRIVVNGEERAITAGATVEALVRDLGLDARTVAVERNGEILPRDAVAHTRLEAGDRLEIVRFVQGGAGRDARGGMRRRLSALQWFGYSFGPWAASSTGRAADS